MASGRWFCWRPRRRSPGASFTRAPVPQEARGAVPAGNGAAGGWTGAGAAEAGGGWRGRADVPWRLAEAGGGPIRRPGGGWRRMAGPSLLCAAPPPAEGQRALFPPPESAREAAQAVP